MFVISLTKAATAADSPQQALINQFATKIKISASSYI
jgi:hypothetical protein